MIQVSGSRWWRRVGPTTLRRSVCPSRFRSFSRPNMTGTSRANRSRGSKIGTYVCPGSGSSPVAPANSKNFGSVCWFRTLPENRQSLIDENSHQPTSKGAFIFKVRRIAGCASPAFLYGSGHSLLIAEHTATDNCVRTAGQISTSLFVLFSR